MTEARGSRSRFSLSPSKLSPLLYKLSLLAIAVEAGIAILAADRGLALPPRLLARRALLGRQRQKMMS